MGLSIVVKSLANIIYPPTCSYCHNKIVTDGFLCGNCWSQLDIAGTDAALMGQTAYFINGFNEHAVSDYRAGHYDSGNYNHSNTSVSAPDNTREYANIKDNEIDREADNLYADDVYADERIITEIIAADDLCYAVRFNHMASKLVSRMKYADNPALAITLSGLMFANLTRHKVNGLSALSAIDVLVPVPLHWTRLWHRRFNQAALLSRGLGKLSGIKVNYRDLIRIRATRHQVGLSRDERRENVADAFKLRDNANFTNMTVAVIDDVYTTGATLRECCQIIYGAGAKKVIPVVFAAT